MKYIIEVEDKPFELLSEDGFTSEKLFRVKGFNSLVFDWNGLNMLTPYTEPNLEWIRKEAYDKGYDDCRDKLNLGKVKNDAFDDGYKCGLADAWEAARKIIFNPDDGGISAVNVHEIFGESSWTVMKDFSVFEVIAKIKAWEEKKQEQEIKVGDVVRLKDDPKLKIWVTSIPDENDILCGLELKEVGANKRKFERTGEHHEVGTILEKLRCENK